jgi:hypothetical protein
MVERFDNDLYWETTYPHNFSESRFQRAETEVDQVLKLAGYQGGKILDLACGPGTHSLASRQSASETQTGKPERLSNASR